VFTKEKDSNYRVTDSIIVRRGSVLVLRQDTTCTKEDVRSNKVQYLIRRRLVLCGIAGTGMTSLQAFRP
jgi:hypothetical protein